MDNRRIQVSIHASAREATLPAFELTFVQRVSIHASAREATIVMVSPAIAMTGFNPRLRTGGDPCFCVHDGDYVMFQSTPPHGRRPELQQANRHRT